MIGNFNQGTNELRTRDLAEYATMKMLMEVIPDLKRQGKVLTVPMMQEFRDAWRKNGEPMDFSVHKPSPLDFQRLLSSTGATNFGEVIMKDYGEKTRADNLTEGFKRMWIAAKDEYDAAVNAGHYLHVITDPEIRAEFIANIDQPFNKAIFAHKGSSLRALNPGDPVELVNRSNFTQRLVTTVAGSAATREAYETEQLVPGGFTETASTEEIVEFDTEKLLGWHGGTIETEQGRRDYRGLSDIMGAYLTKADSELVSKNIDEKELFDIELAHNSVELLKHMRSNGYDFNVRESGNRNQIEVRMAMGENVNVRVFDSEANGTYIGRIYDAYNSYFYNVTGGPDVKRNTKFNPEDSIALLDYVTGNRRGQVVKAVASANSTVLVEGVDRVKSVQVRPIEGRYRAFSFANEEEALTYIGTAINDATNVVNDEFKLNEIQDLIDKGIDDDEILITSPEFQAELEALYSNDLLIREAQERAASLAIHSDDGGREHLEAARNAIVGTYDEGFNPSFVIEHMKQSDRGNERDAMLAALKTVGYDMSKITGNDFAVNSMRERLVSFDPDTAKGIDEVEHPMLKSALETVRDTLKAGNFKGDANGRGLPSVKIDENGVIRWEAARRTRSNKEGQKWQTLSGDIGQVMVPDENGIIKTKFQGDNNYGIVPGFTGYFSFDGDYDDRMKRFRVKGFEQHLTEQLNATVTHQMTRPFDAALQNIPTTLDASALRGLYHGDVYGKRVDLDFMETSQLSPETKEAILKTLSNRVRFDNQFSDHATTSTETTVNRDKAHNNDEGSFSYWKAAGEVNMRVLAKDLANYADLTMTGTGKTQGLIWYLTDGTEINPDGSVVPSKGMLDKDGNRVPDATALQKLPYFDKKSYNAWDRNQMSSNQLMTALKVDENVNTALMAFGGWTFDDSYAVSKEFADRNKIFGATPNEDSMRKLDDVLRHVGDNGFKKEDVLKGSGMMWSDDVVKQGLELRELTLSEDRTERAKARETYETFLEEHGRFRPLQRGDKLSDFGGNKGTIGIVIDRDMAPSDAKAAKLEKEVAFMKANPSLDVISAPYSMLSRHNAGVVRELMDGEVQDLIDPESGEKLVGAMGKLNIIVTDMVVDDKTHAYTREDVLDGKGRKASGQLAWALQSKKADGILNEIYGRNDSAWSTYREYLIATGLDMKADGTIVEGYLPHKDESRNHFGFEPDVDSSTFLDQIKDQGGFLELPFEVDFKTGTPTNAIPVLSASLRQNVELVDGSMRRSDFTNHYANIYDSIGEYTTAETPEAKDKAKAKAQDQFDKIQATIIDRQFNGGHNGKHSYIRDKIMGKRMQHSATGVAVVDPRLNIGEAGMNQAMMDALDAKEGDMVMAFRDPVWRDGAIRAMKVVKDDSVHGVAINPIADKSHDMDFDGDTMGLMKFDTKQANADLVNKFSHWANMIDHGSGKDELYFQSGMDLASAQAKAEKLGDTSPKELYEKAHKNALSDNPKLQKQACRDLNTYSHKLFREHGFATDYVSFQSDETVFESFKKMVDNGAKGSPKKLEDYKGYHNGVKTAEDARDIQYATGVKSDDTGLAGAFSQKLVSIMRNQDITAALESMYPLTQGTLQIKHDAAHARVVNEILSDDMNSVFRGRDVNDQKKKLTPKSFKTQLTSIMEDKMKVDVNEKFIDAVTETLTHKGQIIPLSEAMSLKGSPMDRVAYGGGYDELKRLAAKQESLLTGEQTKLFAPFSMRNADENTKLAKRDTQKVVTIEPKIEAKSVEQEQHVHVDVEDDGVAL